MSVQPTPAWRAKPRCPQHLIAVLERAVNALPPAWLFQPVTGEVFDSIEHCNRRLQGYALAEGFDVVRTGGGTKKVPGARFQCSKHGESTKNWRKLENHVKYDEEGTITTVRQRENTLVSQTGCKWSARVSWKDIGKRGSGEKGFVLTIICLNYYGYALIDNPLSIPTHLRSLDEY